MTTAPDTSAPYTFTTALALREHLCRHLECGSNFHQNGYDLYAHIPEHCGETGRTLVPAYEHDLNALQRLVMHLTPAQRQAYLPLLRRRTEQQQLAGLETMPAPELACALTRALALADLTLEQP